MCQIGFFRREEGGHYRDVHRRLGHNVEMIVGPQQRPMGQMALRGMGGGDTHLVFTAASPIEELNDQDWPLSREKLQV